MVSIPPKQKEGQSDYAYMCTDFIDAVRSAMASGGYKEIDKGVESGGEFLVGYKGNLYKVQSNFSVMKSIDGYDACGCGKEFALGSLASLPLNNPKEAIRSALIISQKFAAGVREPFTIIEQLAGCC